MKEGLEYILCHFLKLVSICAFLLIGSHAQGQFFNLRLENYNTDRGLSQNQVFSIVQDKQGFIWFGTDEGLNRFDGHEFKIFKHDENDARSIAGNSIHALLVDDDSTIWIGTNNGISRYFPREERIQNFLVDYDDRSKPKGNAVSSIRKNADGSIWFTYLGSGVDVLSADKKEFFHYTIHRTDEYQIKSDYVTAVQFLPDGTKILGTRSGLQFINRQGLVLSDQEAKKTYPWKDAIDNSIDCFQLSSSADVIWIGTELSGVYRVNLTVGKIKNFNIDNGQLKFNNNIPSIFEDSKGNIWIGGEAIYILDKKNDVLVPYNESGLPNEVVNRNPILSLYEDNANNIWMGTFRLGVLKYNNDNTRILHFHTNQGEDGLRTDQVLSFNQDRKGNIWVGTDGGGLFKMSPDLSTFSKAPLSTRFSSQVVKCILPDGTGNFWLGTWEGGMMKYNPEKDFLEIFSPDKHNFESRHVWDIKMDSLGNFWVGTLRDGLCYFYPKTKKYIYYRSIAGDSTSLVNNDVLCLLVDSQNALWVGTSFGLSVRQHGARGFKNLPNISVLSLYEAPDKKIWVGTNGDGIIILNHDLSIAKRISEKDGLLSNTICSIQPDDSNTIWVSTYNGLLKINPIDLTIAEVPQIAGLQGKEFIARSSFKSSDGKLFFGGVNGFNLFHPDSLLFNPLTKKVVFTSLKILNAEISPNILYNDRTILRQSMTEVKEVKLSYQDYAFTITFAPLIYNWQQILKYTYFLEGLDDQWQYTTSERRMIHYTNLDPGDYILKVKASFDGKNWPSEVAELKIRITPPWWATVWFRSGAFLLVAFSFYGFYKTRISFLKNQSAKLETLVAMRTVELKKSNEEIHKLLDEVADQKKQIEDQYHELRQINEELGAQRDTLELRGIELEKAQAKLKAINTNLELLVDKRTQKLSDTVRELETFLYRASHDLKGPISSMQGLINVAALENDSGKFAKEYSEFMTKTVLRLDRTLYKLLQKHSIERRKISYEIFTQNGLTSLLDDIRSDIPSYRPNDFNLIFKDSIEIRADRMMLSIILANLLENAFFFSSKAADKKVILEVKQIEEISVLTITDYGPGIKPELREKIFTMFYRGNELSSGNGLGLYLVKGALEKMNGKIELETLDGNYSSFTIKL